MKEDIMDNKIFNVNGKSLERLELALKLAFNGTAASGYFIDDNAGLVFCWAKGNNINSFVVEHSSKQCAEIAFDWLKSAKAKKIEPSEGCQKLYDMDVQNDYGWQVHCEKWGFVASRWEALCAVKPAYLWLGK